MLAVCVISLLVLLVLIKIELPPSKIDKADGVSSVSLSSERIGELWGVVSLHGSVEELSHWWKYGDVNL